MTEIYVRPNKVVTIDGVDYKITAFPAMDALTYQFQLSNPTPTLIQNMIMKGVSKDSVHIDAKKFEQLFAGKIPHLMKLYQEVIMFNFDDPLEESDSSDL